MQEVFKAKVIEAGRITIPQPNRQSAGIQKGDIVEVELTKVA